ncbi:unnamed protein product [Boreogadus saida]
MDHDTGSGDEDAPPPSHLDNASVADVSVEVATVDHAVQKVRRKYHHTRHRRKRRSQKKRLEELWSGLWTYPYLVVVVVTAVVFAVVVTVWALLWVFTCRCSPEGPGALLVRPSYGEQDRDSVGPRTKT